MANLSTNVFSFDSYTVRTFYRNGDIWFAAVDVCAALGLDNPTMALRRLEHDEKTTLNSIEGRPGHGAQEMAIISEPGMYRLVMTSRKDEAKRFTRWVVHEVLPAIRKTGRYDGGEGITLTPAEAINIAGLLQIIPMFAEVQQRAEGMMREAKSPMAARMYDAWHETGVFAWALRNLQERCTAVREAEDRAMLAH